MADSNKSIWDSLDKGLTVTLKSLTLGVILLAILVLSFCSEKKVKETSTWTLGRLELAGLRPTKFSLLGVEFQAAPTEAEVGNAKGLAADLHTMAEDKRVPQEVRDQLTKLSDQVGNYAQKLADRDKKVVAAIKTASRSPESDAKPITGWIYVGRRSSSGIWTPLSDKISLSEPESLRELKIEKDVVLVDKDPAAISHSEDVAAAATRETIRLIRAGSGKLKILAMQESPSIGSAKLEWARVEVAPSDLYEVQR
jgi:hypothetical protein